MKGEKLTTVWGKTFTCQEVVVKNGITYYRDDYTLLGKHLIQGATQLQEDEQSQKVHTQRNRVNKVSRKRK